tara:strand:- start:482 stop:613 length:132 start_codon:yes stop_codon:yes gene_type:complete
VKKFQKISKRRSMDKKRLIPKQKNFVEFLERASNHSKEKNYAK